MRKIIDNQNNNNNQTNRMLTLLDAFDGDLVGFTLPGERVTGFDVVVTLTVVVGVAAVLVAKNF